MDSISAGDDLIDVVVRLPRSAIEETILARSEGASAAAARRLAEAKALLTGSRRREACFPGLRLGDPTWDMILELYVASVEGRDLPVSHLCSLSGGSITTALRHIEQLEALGHVRRSADAADRRRVNVKLLPGLAEAVERWLDLQGAALRLGC